MDLINTIAKFYLDDTYLIIDFDNPINSADIHGFDMMDNHNRSFSIKTKDDRLRQILIPLDALPSIEDLMPKMTLDICSDLKYVAIFEWKDIEPQSEAVCIHPNIFLEYKDSKLCRLKIYEPYKLFPLKYSTSAQVQPYP